MSAPVDVLAVMDVHIAAMAAGRGRVACKDAPFYDEAREQFQKSRAAVAELIEAATPAAANDDYGMDADEIQRLINALARVKGEQP